MQNKIYYLGLKNNYKPETFLNSLHCEIPYWKIVLENLNKYKKQIDPGQQRKLSEEIDIFLLKEFCNCKSLRYDPTTIRIEGYDYRHKWLMIVEEDKLEEFFTDYTIFNYKFNNMFVLFNNEMIEKDIKENSTTTFYKDGIEIATDAK